jgi:hypothetical protein
MNNQNIESNFCFDGNFSSFIDSVNNYVKPSNFFQHMPAQHNSATDYYCYSDDRKENLTPTKSNNLFIMREIEKAKTLMQKTTQQHNPITLSSAVASICNTFINKWPCLNLYFYKSYEKNKYCFSHVHILPHVKISVANQETCTLQIMAYFGGDKPIYDGWDKVPDNEDFSCIKIRQIHKTKFNMILGYVNEIVLWTWGFEIITDADINLMASLDYATDEKTNEIHDNPWHHVLNKPVGTDEFMMQPLFVWRRSEIKND